MSGTLQTPAPIYTEAEVLRVCDALDDADGWVKTPEAYEASAMLQALYTANVALTEELRKRSGS